MIRMYTVTQFCIPWPSDKFSKTLFQHSPFPSHKFQASPRLFRSAIYDNHQAMIRNVCQQLLTTYDKAQQRICPPVKHQLLQPPGLVLWNWPSTKETSLYCLQGLDMERAPSRGTVLKKSAGIESLGFDQVCKEDIELITSIQGCIASPLFHEEQPSGRSICLFVFSPEKIPRPWVNAKAFISGSRCTSCMTFLQSHSLRGCSADTIKLPGNAKLMTAILQKTALMSI